MALVCTGNDILDVRTKVDALDSAVDEGAKEEEEEEADAVDACRLSSCLFALSCDDKTCDDEG